MTVIDTSSGNRSVNSGVVNLLKLLLCFPEKQIDLTATDLKKLRVSELKKILSAWGEDSVCKGCAEKADFIREIERLMPKYDPEAAKKRSQKTDL